MKEILKPMSLEDIKKAVKAKKRGFHEIEFLAGSPVDEGDCKIFVTTKMSYRFTLKYSSNKVVAVENKIFAATTKEELEECYVALKSLSKAQRECVSSHAEKILLCKQENFTKGEPLTKEGKKPRVLTHDGDVDNIIYAANGSVLLEVYKSFQYNIHKRVYRMPETCYYRVSKDGSVEKLDSSDPALKLKLEKIREESRRLAGKKLSPSKPALCYTLKCSNILSIK